MTRQSILPTYTLLLAVIFVVGLCSSGMAYDQWSTNGGATNCGTCHGDFRSNSYTSTVDGLSWGNLHNIHRSDMLSGDCDTCHNSADDFPVFLDSSAGGDGLAAISCAGCHGRAEDNTAANPEVGTGGRSGYGAGLRQHHFRTGVTVCTDCHLDADPANYTTVHESVLPPYYANPGIGHPAMPNDPCNDNGSEDFAGATIGLDNDGDDTYDMVDGDCDVTATPPIPQIAALSQNAPNPFNPVTEIRYTVLLPGWVGIRVYDGAGRLVRTLVGSVHDDAGEFSVVWDGRDSGGRPQPSGVYYYRLDGEGVAVRKMVLIR